MQRGIPSIILLLLFGAAGCGPRYDDAAALRKQGRLIEAARKYAAFAGAKPGDPDAPKALLAAAEIYSVNLGLCAESKPLLENLARNYPDFKMPPEVFRRIFICPDYFPAGPGLKWTYGDSSTLGRNARQETAIVDHTAAGAVLDSVFYAGSTLVSKQKKTYRFSDFDFVERQDRKDTVILSYPLDEGKVWSSSGPEGRLRFRVEKTGLTVKVKAGEFNDCVQISRRVPGMPSWVLEYYAPWTGKVLTAVAGKGYEHRVMELLSYEEKK